MKSENTENSNSTASTTENSSTVNTSNDAKEEGDSIKHEATNTSENKSQDNSGDHSCSTSNNNNNSNSNETKNSKTEHENYFVYYSTIDHKPYDEEEKRRIENAGGMVIIQRINGALAVSRALGDFDYKRNREMAPEDQQVTALPVVEVLERTNSKNNSNLVDSYIVLACDGIYDAISNENLEKYITYKMLSGQPIDQIAKGCLDLCCHLGSRDNMSIIILKLDQAPDNNTSYIDNENKINQELIQFIDGKYLFGNLFKIFEFFSRDSGQDKIL